MVCDSSGYLICRSVSVLDNELQCECFGSEDMFCSCPAFACFLSVCKCFLKLQWVELSGPLWETSSERFRQIVNKTLHLLYPAIVYKSDGKNYKIRAQVINKLILSCSTLRVTVSKMMTVYTEHIQTALMPVILLLSFYKVFVFRFRLPSL